MTIISILAPSQREILVHLGNRHVVFGSSAGLPQPLHFRPETAPNMPPRVIVDEDEATEALIVQSLHVYGMKTAAAIEEDLDADVTLLDTDGNRVLVDIKVKERAPKERDIEQGYQRLTEAARMGQTLEIWYFNVERLKLVIMHLDGSGLRLDELLPLDVWKRTAEGVCDHAQIAKEVEDWVLRVEALYEDIRAWLSDRPRLRCEQSRNVTMSEEVMWNFAVTDRDIPVLDVLDTDQVVASFVPRGLWLIGSWGRIDVITRDRTQVLLALGGPANLEWRLVSSDDRRRHIPFDKNVLLTIVDQS